MKKTKHSLIFLTALCFILSACQSGTQSSSAPGSAEGEPGSETAVPDSESAEPGSETAEADSEKAMENFLAKLEEGNYVLNAAGYLKTTVASRDQVTFEYTEDNYNDFTVMSVNDETFQAIITDGALEEARYLGEGQAIEAAAVRLPNYWMDESVSDGNIWNLFYNTPEEPLKFMSHEEVLKKNILSYVGYADNAVRLMQDVYLVLDAEDPSTAHIQAVVDDDLVARVNYDDIDVEITFGNAQTNELADAWMKDPVYPEARSEWSEVDEFIFNSVFLPEYGLDAIPFPSFASYALKVDDQNFVMDDEVFIRDAHASEEDMADYITLLLSEGFSEAKETDEDGTEKTYYRKMLRDEYKCYSSINLEYDNGVSLTAKKYYDFPVYDTLDAVNEAITKAGFAELPASDNFTSVLGTDKAYEMTEGWLYFFDYDLGLYVDIAFDDKDAVTAYLNDYQKSLEEAGWTAVRNAEEEMDTVSAYLHADRETLGEEGFKALRDEEDGEAMPADRYESPNGNAEFRYRFNDDNTFTMLLSSERYYSADETEKMITDAGFPAIELNDTVACRDLRMFHKVREGRDTKAFLAVSVEFESTEEAEEFLNSYETALNDAGFDRENPDVAGTLKRNALVNADGSMVVGIDFFDSPVSVYFDFIAQ
ncbi:MAG: hypothetical protein K6G61_00735 [Solobacterium sp.]|nr:hypothetical protein [Solobacterium sp.]